MINKICEFQLKKKGKKTIQNKKEYKYVCVCVCVTYVDDEKKNELFSFKFVSLFTRYLSIIGFD